jgi:hypothetical protein
MSAPAGVWRPGLFHAHQLGVANQVLLQVRVDGTLATQPGKSALCFPAQMNLWNLNLPLIARGAALDLDVHANRRAP